MKCPICNGKGYVYNALGSFNEDCGHCQGTGKVRVEGEPLTNEEWFTNLSTEEKARFLACEFTVACDDYAYSNNKETWNEKYWLKWLKEKHNESV